MGNSRQAADTSMFTKFKQNTAMNKVVRLENAAENRLFSSLHSKVVHQRQNQSLDPIASRRKNSCEREGEALGTEGGLG